MENGKVQVVVNTSSVSVNSDFDHTMTVALLLHAAAKLVKEDNQSSYDKVTAFQFGQLALESYEN